MKQSADLARRIPRKYITKSAKGMDATDHTVITQLLNLRVPGWSMEVMEVLRTDMPDQTVNRGKPNEAVKPGGRIVTGVILRLRCTIDGNPTVIDEVGGVENAAIKDGDGERMKHAMSDALKRCAMRIGLGLHIWAQDRYFLDEAYTRLGAYDDKAADDADDAAMEAAPEPTSPIDAEPPSGDPDVDYGEPEPTRAPPPPTPRPVAPTPPVAPPPPPVDPEPTPPEPVAPPPPVANSGDGQPVPEGYYEVEEEINAMRGPALQTALREAGLDVAGTVPALKERLRNHVLEIMRAGPDEEDDDPNPVASEPAVASTPEAPAEVPSDPPAGEPGHEEYGELDHDPVNDIQAKIIRDSIVGLTGNTMRAWAQYRRTMKLPDAPTDYTMGQAMRAMDFLESLGV